MTWQEELAGRYGTKGTKILANSHMPEGMPVGHIPPLEGEGFPDAQPLTSSSGRALCTTGHAPCFAQLVEWSGEDPRLAGGAGCSMYLKEASC